jgi:ribokinase
MTDHICVIGNIVADFIGAPVNRMPNWGELYEIPNNISLNIGGNGAISAVCAARLGLNPFLVGKIGKDPIGEQLLGSLKAEGININHIKKVMGSKTSVTLVLVNKDGERMFFHNIGSNAKLTANDVRTLPSKTMSALLLCSMFILPHFGPLDAVVLFKRARRSGIPTFLDVAWDPKGKWDLGELYEHIDFLIPNEVELRNLARTSSIDRAVTRLHKKGVNNIIVKRGSSGCAISSADQSLKRIKAPRVKVVDSTGAGDAFNAGFISEYLKTREVHKSAEFATYTASMSVRGFGGTTSAPSRTEVRGFIKKQG